MHFIFHQYVSLCCHSNCQVCGTIIGPTTPMCLLTTPGSSRPWSSVMFVSSSSPARPVWPNTKLLSTKVRTVVALTQVHIILTLYQHSVLQGSIRAGRYGKNLFYNNFFSRYRYILMKLNHYVSLLFLREICRPLNWLFFTVLTGIIVFCNRVGYYICDITVCLFFVRHGAGKSMLSGLLLLLQM